MEYLPYAMVMSHRIGSLDAFSALPDAPVVAHLERPSAVRRTRSVAAAAVYRLGDRLSPARRPVFESPSPC